MTRHIAHIIIEAETPLKVGSNANNFLQDSPVQKDWNGLPMILGTSIAGVLRKDFKGDAKDIFGEDNGSKIIFSNVLLLDENKIVNEGLILDEKRTPFLKLFDNLPIREHTAITDKGVAKDNSKFDEEVVYKGTRFKFSIEMIEDDKESFDEVLALLSSASFRLGGGSTKGFGKLNIIEIQTSSFDISSYENYSSSLNTKLINSRRVDLSTNTQAKTYTNYTLKITPDNFFMFGSGFGDSDADQTPVYEKVIDYKNAKLSDKQILIPASSIKGALSHRTAFYYNKEMMKQGKDYKQVEESNDAVKAIFGHKKELDKNNNELGQKGKILISDCFKTDKKETKTFDHVAIDRFTGGAKDSALFQEKTIAQKDKWKIEMLLETGIEEKYIKAFESALSDICSGALALGGMTTKGHGVFGGSIYRDGEEI